MADLSRRVVVECSGITHCALRTVRVAVCLHNAIIFLYCRGQIHGCYSASSQLAAFTQLQCRGYTSTYGRHGPGVEKILCHQNGSVFRFSFFAFVDSFLRNSSVYVSRKEVGESDRKRSKLPFKIGRFDQIKTNECWCHQQFQLKDGSINVGTVNGFRGKDERRVGLPASHL